MKKWIALLLASMMAFCLLTGCGASQPAQEEATTEAEEADTEEAEDPMATGDASKDDPLNQDDIGEKEILVVSFGTSFNDSRVATIGAIENAIKEAYEKDGWSVRRAFTSDIIINHVKEFGEDIDSVDVALQRAKKNGVKQLVVQPTHLMSGAENQELQNTLADFSNDFEISIGSPLLTSDDDYNRVAEALIEATKDYQDDKTAICFMGHGTPAENTLVDPKESNKTYSKMQEILTEKGGKNYYVGVVESDIEGLSLDSLVPKVKEGGEYEKVVLRPMMVVAGDHANNDMADEEDPESWASTFKSEGYEVETVIEGLGQLEGVQQIYVDHAKEAIDNIGK